MDISYAIDEVSLIIRAVERLPLLAVMGVMLLIAMIMRD